MSPKSYRKLTDEEKTYINFLINKHGFEETLTKLKVKKDRLRVAMEGDVGLTLNAISRIYEDLPIKSPLSTSYPSM